MFTAQLAAFLASHHHAAWLAGLFSSTQRFEWLLTWATRHGFLFHS